VHSDAGRVLVAIRENELRCRYLGIRTATVKTGLMVVSAIVAAAAGYALCRLHRRRGAGTGRIRVWNTDPDLGSARRTRHAAWPGRRHSRHRPGERESGGSIPYVWELVVGLAFMAVIVAMPGGFLPLLGMVARSLVLRVSGRDLRTDVEAAPQLINAPQRSSLRPSVGAPAIEVRNLTRHFGSLTVLDNIDFAAQRAELVSLVGPMAPARPR
jgi:ABC-type branched-chain amino acid transport system, permease component